MPCMVLDRLVLELNVRRFWLQGADAHDKSMARMFSPSEALIGCQIGADHQCSFHAEVFDSPVRREITQNLNQQRTPGISVLTPGRRKMVPAAKQNKSVWDSDEDELIDEATGMPYGVSPPKTMQFHVPQSRLLKTPAREASKQIVDNILASAGMPRDAHGEEYSDDFEIDVDLEYDDHGAEEDSPSIVRRAVGLEDETF